MSRIDIRARPVVYSDAAPSFARYPFANIEWQHEVIRTGPMLQPKQYWLARKSLNTLSDWMEWTLSESYRDMVKRLYKPLSVPLKRGGDACDPWVRVAGKENDASPVKRRKAPATAQKGASAQSVAPSESTYENVEERKHYAEILRRCLEERRHFTRTTCRLASRLRISPVRENGRCQPSLVRKEKLDVPHTCGLQQRLCLVSHGCEVQGTKSRVGHSLKMLDSPDWMAELKELLAEFHKGRSERIRGFGHWHGVPRLTEAMELEVEEALTASPSDDVLAQAFNQKIKRSDVATLAGLNWLNDEVINFYMNMLMQRSQENPKYPRVYAFNTFFYPRLESGGHAAVRRWTKKVDVFSYDLLLVPLHFRAHWCLAVADLRKNQLAYYDSMGSDSDLQTLDTIKEYLQEECRDKRKQELDTSGWTSVVVKDVPLQMNGSDCGMFLCQYAECLSRGARIGFTQQQMPYFRRRMVYEILHQKVLS